MRDFRVRMRKMALARFMGDVDEFESWSLGNLETEAEMSSFQEEVDFAASEGHLTAATKEAADNVLAWAAVLRGLLKARKGAAA